MKFLVTGANGYLGRGIIKTLLDSGASVVAADFTLHDVDSRAVKYECDLFSISNPMEYFGNPDVLLHLAWRDGFLHYSDAHILDLPMHYSFIKKMVGSGLQHVAVLGSMHEVGFFEGCIKEDTPCRPSTPYGIAKNALRELTYSLCKENGVIFQWLRGFYIVSNSTSGGSIFSKIAKADAEGEKEFPFTLGQNQYDFCDYDLFCKQVTCAISQSKVNGVINIGSGYPERLCDRVERFIEENGFKIRLNYGAFPDRPYDSKAVWGDGRKIQTIMDMSKRDE